MDSSMSASPPHAALLRAATELDKSWSAEKFAPSVTVPLIELALAHYALLDKRVKVRLILAAGCLIKSQRAAMTSAVTTFVHRALDDDEEWVRTTARLIGGGDRMNYGQKKRPQRRPRIPVRKLAGPSGGLPGLGG